MKDNYNEDLNHDIESLELLQKIIDDKIISSNKTYELQCLGVALGRIASKNIDELDWYIIEDEYGRDPTLRYLNTTWRFNTLTMISKRIEKCQDVDVKSLYDWIFEKVGEIKDGII